MIMRWRGEVLLADGATIASVCGVSKRTVRRHCRPVEYDRATRVALYDAIAADEMLAEVYPRERAMSGVAALRSMA